jgi:MoxR-like ATPase
VQEDKTRFVKTLERVAPWEVTATVAVTPGDGARTPVRLDLGRLCRLPDFDPAPWRHIYDRDEQIRIVWRCVQVAVDLCGVNRPHVLLHGPPACGKSEILTTLGKVVGERNVWRLDGGTVTKAGLERQLLARVARTPFVVIEEIEKAGAPCLRVLLQAMDTRATVQRVNGRDGSVATTCRSLFLATCNDMAKLEKFEAGAIASRFAMKLRCGPPSWATLEAILLRECGRPEWVAPVLDWMRAKGCTDPRTGKALLVGGDGLLDGSWIRDYERTNV